MTTTDQILTFLSQALYEANIRADEPILVAYSGGLDSSVLVDLLTTHHHHRGGPAIELIHVDHGLRPDSSKDAQFCQRQAKTGGLPIEVVELNLGRDERRGQTAARTARLAAIADYALARGITYVAFAHHGDDRLETFLLNLKRGTGLDGLTSMKVCSDFPTLGTELVAIRPLLGVSRAALEDYARRHGVEFVEDPTNLTDAYERNRIRHHILPHLAGDSGDRRAISRALQNLEAERQAAEFYARQLTAHAEINAPGLRRRAFERQPLADAPQATVARLFHHLQPALDAPSLHRIYDAICAPPTGAPHHLTLSGCVITIAADRVVYEPSQTRGAKDVLQREVQPIQLIPFDRGQAPFFDGVVCWRLVENYEYDPDSPRSRWAARFDVDKLARPLTLSGPPEGAQLRRLDNKGEVYHQKLSKIFSAHSVDADLRWRWPCLLDANGELIWAAGLLRGAYGLPTEQSRRVWEIEVTELDEWS